MWIRRSVFEHLLTRADKAEASAAMFRQQAAVQQQNFDWLANHVNRLEGERAALLERVLHLGVVVPQIGRTRADVAPLKTYGMGIPAEDRPVDEEPGMALAAMQSGSFEDMGDEAAGRFGVTHDPRTGTVMYTA